MLSVNAGKHNKTRPEEQSVVEKAESCLNSSKMLRPLSTAHWFLVNTGLRTGDTDERLKANVKWFIGKELLDAVGVQLEVTDVAFEEVEDNTAVGNETARKGKVNVCVEIADEDVTFHMNVGTIVEKQNDKDVFLDFVRQGNGSYSDYRNYLYAHNAIFGIKAKLNVKDYKFENVKHGILTLSLHDMKVRTLTSAEAGGDDIMQISMMLRMDAEGVTVLFKYKLQVNTSEITPNCTLTSDEKWDIKSSGLNVKRKMDAFFENVCNTAVEECERGLDILIPTTFPSITRHGRMPDEVFCRNDWVHSGCYPWKICFAVTYPPVDNVQFGYAHAQKLD
eukprot:GHVS01014867.1.p1 GENE.GHVS01014867.1~~GHVS01014867.1.p1  ORF type:complete len:382 (+),score=47.94 GHVS01014867.1:142-1146(+)